MCFEVHVFLFDESLTALTWVRLCASCLYHPRCCYSLYDQVELLKCVEKNSDKATRIRVALGLHQMSLHD